MKRALILIVVITLSCFGLGAWLDHWQTETAYAYMRGARAVREAVLEGRGADARAEQAYLHALWQHDEPLLNALISHHHTRAVNTAMLELATALEQDWPDWALRALDALQDALDDVAVSDSARWENVL